MIRHQEEAASPVGSDKVAEEEGEDLDDEEEYDEEEEEDDDDRPRKKPRHGGFILDEAGRCRPAPAFASCVEGALTRLCASCVQMWTTSMRTRRTSGRKALKILWRKVRGVIRSVTRSQKQVCP